MSDIPSKGDSARGAALFKQKNCSFCHSVVTGEIYDPANSYAPSMSGYSSRAPSRTALSARDYTVQSIIDPDVFKVPGFENSTMVRDHLTPQQVADIAEYLLTL